jgi:cell division protein FtsI (penicillin-binding protein 3)
MNNIKNYNTPIVFIFILFILIFFIILLQLFNLQIIQYKFFKSKAQKMHLTTIDQQIGRGDIYDRNGIKMATNIRTASICACPRKIRDKIQVASYLSEKLNMDKKEIYNKLKSGRGFIYIKRKVDIDIAEEIMKKDIKGIFPQYEEKRIYP